MTALRRLNPGAEIALASRQLATETQGIRRPPIESMRPLVGTIARVRSVLIVEDLPERMAQILELIRKFELDEVKTACNLQDALGSLRVLSDPASMLITDIVFPKKRGGPIVVRDADDVDHTVMAGLKLIRTAKKEFPKTPILAQSSSWECLNLARKNGADQLLHKNDLEKLPDIMMGEAGTDK
ncbi:MAG: hypothetical protein Q7T16_06130 [Candidatus Burarchaeum sp.]|nr:hypothetical protein [Candidatus Burarchaeum sp.]MDO8340206.1 hypothetical protein [Candidatus Burarchaeum sp.]